MYKKKTNYRNSRISYGFKLRWLNTLDPFLPRYRTRLNYAMYYGKKNLGDIDKMKTYICVNLTGGRI